MKMRLRLNLIVFVLNITNISNEAMRISEETESNRLFEEHAIVSDSKVFPYMVAVLKKYAYVSAGALINEKWVLTAADSMFLMRDSLKTVRVRLGSINYKRGGIVLPIKMVHIHPFFDDQKPVFDIALLMLPEPVRITPSVAAIRLQKRPKDIASTHFIVTSWNEAVKKKETKSRHLESIETIARRRMLSVSHLHPADTADCADELSDLGINSTDVVMCLDPPVKADLCSRDVGAPVVLNGVLWGIISSWRPADCDEESAGTSFANRVSADDVGSWIHTTVHGHRWNYQ